jgi:hypothetical protein
MREEVLRPSRASNLKDKRENRNIKGLKDISKKIILDMLRNRIFAFRAFKTDGLKAWSLISQQLFYK